MIGEAAIVRRIQTLTRRAGNIAAGNYMDPAPAWTSPRELAGLAGAFNSMSRSLDSRDEKRRRITSYNVCYTKLLRKGPGTKTGG